MRTKRYYISLLIVVLSCSLLLISCDAITAQKISDTDSGSLGNGGTWMNGGRGTDGGGRGTGGGFPGMNGGRGTGGPQGGDGTQGGTP